MEVRRLTKRVHDLESESLLSLKAVRIDGVHERDRMCGSNVANQGKGSVEVALDGQHSGAVGYCLGELAKRDLTVRDEDVAFQSRSRRKCGGGGGSVAGGGAHDRLHAGLDCFADGHGHTAVFEGAGWVETFELEVDRE